MQTGKVVSGALHATLIGLAVFGEWLLPDTPPRPFEIAQVTLIQGSDFDAAISAAPATPEGGFPPPPTPRLTAPAQPPEVVAEAPAPPPEPAPAPAQSVPLEAAAPDRGAPDVPAEAAPAPERATPPQAEAAPSPPAPAPETTTPRPVQPQTPPAPSLRAASGADALAAAAPSSEPDLRNDTAPAPSLVAPEAPAPVRDDAPPPPRTPAAPRQPTAPPAAATPVVTPPPPPPSRPAKLADAVRTARAAEEKAAARASAEAERRAVEAAVATAAAQAAPDSGAGTSRVSQPIPGGARAGLIAGIRKHFTPVQGALNAAGIAVKFEVTLSRDGRIVGRPKLVAPGGTLDQQHGALRRFGLAALIRADEEGVFSALPADSYDRWRTILVTFTPEEVTFL